MEKKKTKKKDFNIMLWIMENKNDTQLMDQVNFLSFPFTTKYLSKYGSIKSTSDGSVDYGEDYIK